MDLVGAPIWLEQYKALPCPLSLAASAWTLSPVSVCCDGLQGAPVGIAGVSNDSRLALMQRSDGSERPKASQQVRIKMRPVLESLLHADSPQLDARCPMQASVEIRTCRAITLSSLRRLRLRELWLVVGRRMGSGWID